MSDGGPGGASFRRFKVAFALLGTSFYYPLGSLGHLLPPCKIYRRRATLMIRWCVVVGLLCGTH